MQPPRRPSRSVPCPGDVLRRPLDAASTLAFTAPHSFPARETCRSTVHYSHRIGLQDHRCSLAEAPPAPIPGYLWRNFLHSAAETPRQPARSGGSPCPPELIVHFSLRACAGVPVALHHQPRPRRKHRPPAFPHLVHRLAVLRLELAPLLPRVRHSLPVISTDQRNMLKHVLPRRHRQLRRRQSRG